MDCSDSHGTFTELDARKLTRYEWRLLAPLVYLCPGHDDEDDLRIEIPAAFVSDLTSVPWFARWAISRDGDHVKASVLHDWLYWRQPWVDGERMTRKEADDLFRHAMQHLGVPGWRIRVAYRGVRVGGGRAWRRSTWRFRA